MRAYILGGLVVVGVLLGAGRIAAHHSFAAEFDANKPVTLKGIFTKVEWTNPHVWFYVNVKDEKTGEVTNWGAEMGPPHGLQRRGWRRETLKIGEEVTRRDARCGVEPGRRQPKLIPIAQQPTTNHFQLPRPNEGWKSLGVGSWEWLGVGSW